MLLWGRGYPEGCEVWQGAGALLYESRHRISLLIWVYVPQKHVKGLCHPPTHLSFTLHSAKKAVMWAWLLLLKRLHSEKKGSETVPLGAHPNVVLACFLFATIINVRGWKLICKDRGKGGGKKCYLYIVKIENFHPVLTSSLRVKCIFVRDYSLTLLWRSSIWAEK